MGANLKQAIEKYGIVEFSRWMLNDGQFLGVSSYDDHRIVGEFCTDSWLDFIKKDCISVHYDGSCGYLWIRINGYINCEQRQAFEELISNRYIKVRELYIQIYEDGKYQEDLKIDETELAELYLTDQIAYNMVVSERC